MTPLATLKLGIKRTLNATGCNRVLHHLAFNLRPSQVVEYRGVRFNCSGATGYEAQLLANQYNEDRVIHFMAERLRGIEGCFLDIGANIGVFSLTLAKACGFPVYAFEPEPLNFLKLQANTQINPGFEVTAINLACGDQDGAMLDFTVPFTSNRGVPFVGRYPNPPLFAWELSVPCCRVDTWLPRHEAGRVAGFKIDVESFEEPVLRGMLNVLAQPGPLRGLVELHPHFRPVDCEAIAKLLEVHGFVIAELTRDAELLAYRLPRQDGHAIWVEKA